MQDNTPPKNPLMGDDPKIAPIATLPNQFATPISDFKRSAPAPVFVPKKLTVQSLYPESKEQFLDSSLPLEPVVSKPVSPIPAQYKRLAKVTTAVVVSVLLLGISVITWNTKSTQNNLNSSKNSSSEAPIPNQNNPIQTSLNNATLKLNRNTTIARGKNLLATGSVVIQNEQNSDAALRVQDSAGSNLLVVDSKNKNVGIGTSPTGTAKLQVVGDISSSGHLIASGGGSSLGNDGLRINSVLVCTAAGCNSKIATAAPDLTAYAKKLDIVGLAELGANQAFTGSNVFKSTSPTAFQIQNASGALSLLVVDTSNGKVGIGLAPNSGGAALQVGGAVDAGTGFAVNGTAGSTFSCAPGEILQQAVVKGGIITSGLCVIVAGGSTATLQQSYDASVPAKIVLSNVSGFLQIQDAASPLATDLFEVTSNGGATKYFAVNSLGISVTGNVNTTGQYQIGGVSINTAGTLSNVAYLSGNQSFSGINTFSNASNSFTGNGAGLSNVDAATLGGNNSGFFTNASNLSSGTLNDLRLSSNVTKAGNTFNGINQLVQTTGGGFLPALNGSNLTNLNASNLSTGTVNDSLLSANVTKAGNTFNGNSQLVQLTAGGILPVLSGANLTSLDAGNVSSGTLNDLRLSTNVTLAGNSFNGNNQLVKLTAGGLLPVLDGSNLTNVDAAKLNGQAGSYYTNATNISSGTLSDARLSANVTLQGNTFNGNSQLVQLTAAGILPVLSGANLTNLNASNISSGTLSDLRLSSNVTLQGNTFNGVSQLVQLDGSGNLPALNASALTNINASNISSGTLNDLRLSANVTLQGNTFNGVSQLVKLDASGNLPALNGSALTNLNGSNISTGTVADARLSGNVTLQGNTFNGNSQLVQLTAAGKLPVLDGSNLTTLNATNITTGTLADGRLSSNVPLKNAANVFTGNNTFTLNTAGLAVQDAASPLGTTLFSVTNNSGATNYFSVSATGAKIGTDNVCTTAGNCAGSGSGVTTAGGTAGKVAKFTAGQAIGDSIISDDGSTVSIGGTLAVNTITPTASLTVGTPTQTLTLQGDASTSLSAKSGSFTNSLVFVAPAGSSKTITIPNATGTVAVSASGPLALDAAGNLTCPTCLTSGGGSGVSSVNSLTGALTLAGTTNQVVITPSGNTLTFSLPQDIATTSNVDFGSVNLASGGLYKINGIQVSSSALSNDANLAKVNGNTTFSGNNTFSSASNSFTGNGSGLTSVDAATLNGNAGSYYTNATNISSGTLSDARLSSNVPLKNAANVFSSTNEFDGTVLAKTNSATAFQVQDASSANVLSVDSLNNKVIVNEINFGTSGNANQIITKNMIVTSAVTVGDVVIIDTANAGQVSTTSVGNSNKVYGIATKTNGAGVAQGIVISGTYQVNIDATSTVAIGDFIASSGTTGKATTNSNPAAGTILGRALSAITSAGSGQSVWIQVTPDVGGGSAGSGVTAIGTINSQTKSSDGGVISGTSIYFQTADAGAPGLVSTGTQTFAGAKTFTGAFLAQNTSNSTTAFQIQNAAGTSNLLVADTTNSKIGINKTPASGGAALQVSGGIDITGVYTISGTQITSAALSNDANLAKLNATQTFTADNTFSSATNSFTGNGAGLTNLNATNVASGTLADARLSANVTLQGNTFNGNSQLVQLTAAGILPVLSGANLTNLNASNISSGTLSDLRLSSNVTLQGNTFNGVSQLVQLDGSGNLPALNASALTNINASNISSGTLNDLRLSANVTLQGNTFNGVSQLVKLDASGNLPALNGSALTNLNGSNISTGTVADARLSGNVTLQGNTFNGNSQLVQLTAAGKLPVLDGSNLTTLNATNITTGTLADGRLSSNVPLKNAANVFSNTNNITVASTTAFQVQNATNSVLTVDTSGNKVILGTASALSGQLQFQGSGGAGTLTLAGPTTPNAGNFTLSIPAITANANICTDNSICSGYASSASVSGKLNKDAVDTSSAAVTATGNLYAFTNTSSAINSGVLKLDNGNNTGTTLTVTGTTNYASGKAYIVVNNTNGTPSGNLLDLQSNAVSQFSVDATGNITATGNISIATGKTYQINGTQITSAALSNDANLAKLNATQTFTGDNTFSSASNSFTGNGAGLTNLNATNVASGTLADARLSANVTLQGNTFNGNSQLVQLTAAGILPVLSGANLTNLNASNISSGTLSDLRLSSNVTLQGNTFNGVSQLVQLDGSGNLPALNASALTNINASNISSGTLNDLRLSANVTLQGNTFNGVSQLVKLDASGNLPALNGSALTNLNGSNISTGTVADARLSGNVTLQGNTFNGNSQLVQLTAAGKLPVLDGSNLTTLNATNITTGTLADGRLSSNVPLKNAANVFSNTNEFDGTVLAKTNSATAFQVQNSSNFTVLNVDTNAGKVTVKGITTEATYSSELNTASDFSTQWTNTGWTTTTTQATHNTGNTSVLSNPAITGSATDVYQVTYTLGSVSAGSVNPRIGSVDGESQNSNGTYTSYIRATSSNAFGFVPTSAFNGIVSSVSVKKINSTGSVVTINNSDATAAIEIRTGGTGNTNTFIGIDSGKANVSGISNTALGAYALQQNVSGLSNVAIGFSTLQSNKTGSSNIALGAYALNLNTIGSSNVALGNTTLQNNTSGSYNIAIGDQALFNNTTGTDNVANGFNSLNSNLTGVRNVASGNLSLQTNQTGNSNVASGFNSLGSNLSGSLNASYGAYSLYSNNSGNNNSGFGGDSLRSITTGSNNTAIGYQAGYRDPNVTTFVTLNNLQNATMVGYGAQAQASNVLILGGAGANAVNVGIGTTSPSSLFSVSPDIYDTGTASQTASTTVVGSGTTWTANMVGMEFIFANGNKYTISGFIDATDLTLSASATNTSQAYRIHNPAFAVSSSGQTSIRTSANSTTAFQIQNAAGTSNLLVADTTNSKIGINKTPASGGAALQVSGGIDITGVYTISGTQITSAALSNDSNLAKLNGTQTFTADNTFSSASNSFTGNGAGLTSLNGSNISTGTVADARLSANVTLQGNTFNGNSQLVQLTAGGILPVLSGANLTSLNASNISSGTLNDLRLSSNVTLQGNTFNGVSQLVQLDGSGNLPALNASALTNLNASNISSGTLNDLRLSANVTLQGNTFNGVSQLVKLDASGNLPALNGAALTNLNASNISTGTVADARLSANVTLQGNTFNGNSQLVQLTAAGKLPVLDGSNLTTLNATNISSGTLADARLSSNVPLKNTANIFTNTNNITVASTTAFQVQNATNSVLTVDTTGNKVILGTASALSGQLQFQGSGGAGTLTLAGPTTPNAGNFTLSIPAITANANICTDNSICTGYASSSSVSGKLNKDAVDTSSAAVTATGNLYAFTNTSSAINSGVLKLDNGNNTGTTLTVTGTTNYAAGKAYIVVNNTNGTPSGNLIDLQANASSVFSVDATGNVTAAGDINIASGKLYKIAGTQITSAALSNDANLAKLNGTQTFTADNTFSSASNSFTGNGAGLTSLNGSNISTGTVADARLSANVTLQGNTFNGNSQLVQLTAAGILPVLSGANLTSLNASNISSGTLNDLRLSSNVTLQGNTFNGVSQLVQLTAAGKLPVLDGSNLTTLNATNISSGTLADARLSANVALLDGTNTFAPTANNAGNIFKQTSGTATSGNIFDIQTVNGTGHFLQITNAAANEGAVTLQSVGATRNLTLESGSGTIAIGNGATTHTVNIAAGSGANNTTVAIANGVTGAGNTSAVTIGSNNAAGSTTLIQGGNGAGAISLQAASSGTILLGTINNNNISTGTGTIALNGDTTVANDKTLTANGLVILQPATSLISGQSALSQTLTNASSTGGTVNGYNQTITVANTVSASTTNGINIAITDATTLGNTLNGNKITITNNGTGVKNSTAFLANISGSGGGLQTGLDASVANGIGVKAVSSGAPTGTSWACGNFGAQAALGICGAEGSGTNGTGILGQSNSTGGTPSDATSISGIGVIGYNYSSSTNGTTRFGVKGTADNSGASGAYSSIGVAGTAKAASATASAYGGYFTIDPTTTSTAGAALYASNSTNTANILQLQDNTSDIFVVGDGGSVAITPSDATKTISLGSTAQTGTITLGQYNGASTSIINIGTNAGATSTQQVNIASSSSGINTAVLGSTSSTSSTTIQGGSGAGGIALTAAGSASTGIIAKTTTNSTAAFQVQNSNSRSLLNVDSTNSAVQVGNTTDGSNIVLSATGNANGTIRKSMNVGGTVAANDVVVIDSGANGQVKTTTTANDPKVFGIATTTSTPQDIVIGGVFQVNLLATNQAITPGDYLVTTTTAGKVDKASGTPPTGTAIGQALESKTGSSGGTIWVYVTPGGGGTGTSSTLQQVYDASSSPQIVLDSSPGASGLLIRDNATPLATNILFSVQNNGGGTKFLDVRNNGVDIIGAGTSSFTTSSGNLSLQAGGTGTVTINTVGAGTVNLGTANTTTIGIGSTSSAVTIESSSTANLFNGATAHTIQLGTGAAVQTITIGSTNTTSTTTINGGTGAGGITLSATASGSTGIIAKTTNNSTAAFQIQNANTRSLLTVDSTNSLVKIGNTTDGSNIVLSATGNANSTIRKSMNVGGTVAANDLVVIDTSADGQVRTTTTASDPKVFGIATTTTTPQDIVTSGTFQVNLSTASAAITPGDYLVSSTTAGQVTKASGTPPTGTAIGQALEAKGGGVGGLVWVYVTPGAGGTGTGSILQQTYDASSGGATPEIVLNNGGDTGGIDIQNNNASPITGSLFAIRDKTASGLGASLFNVADTGLTTITVPTATAGVSQTALTISQSADTNIANASKTGLSITSGAITQNTAANTGTYVGADITNPALTLTTGTALNAYGLRVTTGNMTQTAGALTQNGIYVDSGATTFTTGGTLNGVNVNVGAIAAVGTYKGLNISTNGTARTFSAGASITGINLDLSNNITADGASLTGINVQTRGDTVSIANATKTGLSISSSAITENTAAATGTYTGINITTPALTLSTGTSLTSNGLKVAIGTLFQTAGLANVNGVYVDTSTMGSPTTSSTTSINGININIGSIGISGSGTFSGLNISTNGTSRSFSSAVTGINLDLNSNVSSSTSQNQTGIAIATTNDTNLNGATKIGLKITSGNIGNQGPSAGTYTGIDLTVPALSIPSGVGALNAYGLKLTTGNLSQVASTITENGIYVDSGSTTFTSGGTLNGINVNVGAIAAVGTYKGLNISTNGTARTFTAGASITGVTLDLSTNITATGTSLTGLSVSTAADTAIAAATKTGLSISTGAITETNASTGTYNGISLLAPGAISTITAAGTLNWNAANLTVANATTSTGGSTINANGLKITTGTLTQTLGTLNENGLSVDVGGNINSGTFNGIKIAASSLRTITAGATVTGINLDLNNGITADGVSLTGMSIATPADTAITSATKTGLSISTGAITQTTGNVGTYNGLLLSSPGAIQTTTSAGTLNWNGAALTVANATANFAGSTINANGLKITTGTISQAGSTTLIENGLLVDNSATTFTSGTLNGVNVNVGAIAATGTYKGLNISTNGTARTFTAGANITGLNLDLNSNVTATGTTLTGLAISTPGDSNINNAVKKGLVISSGNITENTASVSATYVGADITNPTLTISQGVNLNSYGLRVTTGNMTRTAGTINQNGIFVDSSATTISGSSTTLNGIYINNGGTTMVSGSTVNGISMNYGDVAAGTYKGLNISTNGTARTFTAGASVSGIYVDLDSTTTATGLTETGITIITTADTNIGSATKTGLRISSGVGIAEASAATGNYYGIDIQIADGAVTNNSGILNVVGLNLSPRTNLANASTGTLNYSGITFSGSGTSINQQTAAGTINWNGQSIIMPNVSNTISGGTINANGLSVATGTITQFAGSSANVNGLSLDLSATTITTGGIINGIKITPMATEPSVGTTTGINIGTIGSGGQAGGSSGIQIGTGWDASILGTGALSVVTSSNGNISLLANGTGGTVVQSSSNSTTALQVKNNTNGVVLGIDTTNSNTNNLIGNPSVESAIAAAAGNWKLKGSATVTQDATQHFNGSNSLKVITTTAANDGAQQQLATTLSVSTSYIASFYVLLDSTSSFTSGSTYGVTSLQAGYSSTGASDDTPCLTPTFTALPSQWTKVTCNLTTPGTTSSSNYFYVKNTNTTAHTYYVDSVLLQTEANTQTNYREGGISLQGAITSSLVLQNSSNSTSAFTIQNSAGTNIFNVDTTDSNLITNPGFEVNSAGWSAEVAGPSGLGRDATTAWLGYASLKVPTAATANAGAKFVTGNTQPTQLAVSTQYTLSWYAKLSGGTFTDIKGRYSVDGGTTFIECTPSAQTVSTSGWTRFSCSLTTAATTPSSTAYIAIVQTAATSHTFYIDGVQLTPGATTTVYGAGAISLNGPITSPVAFVNGSDSNTAFQVQNSSSTNMFTVDTLNKTIQIGSSTTDNAAVVLVLDSYNQSTDPTSNGSGVNGSMYYNTSMSKFRCYENAVWRNCLDNPSNQSVADQAVGASTNAYLTNSAFTVPSGGVKVGSQLKWTISVAKTAAGTAVNTYKVHVGAAGTTGDTARITFTLAAETAVADTAQITIVCTVRTVSATGTMACNFSLAHNLTTTGFVNQNINVTSATFDNSALAGQFIGVSVTTGLADSYTYQQVQATSINL